MGFDSVLAVILTLTAVASFINHRFLKLPITIGLTIITLALSLSVIGLQALGVPKLDFIANEILTQFHFDRTFLNGMLGFLLFAGALHINLLELAKQGTIIAMLATISVALSTVMVAGSLWLVANALGFHYPFAVWLTFGALISPTDPIAVLGILKSANIPKSVVLKIAGESLFNDGAAIVLFVVAAATAFGESPGHYHAHLDSFVDVLGYFIQQAGGGALLGTIAGYVGAMMLQRIDDGHVATLITLAVVSAGYASAEHVFHVSGVIAMGISGLIIGFACRNSDMSKESIERLDDFWEIVDEILNAVLFVMIGLEYLALPMHTFNFVLSVLAIIIVLLVRWISVAVPVWANSMFRKFTAHVVVVMTWGGLRGGVSIALALTLPESPERDLILSLTYSIVIFSILVQGMTLKPLSQRLFHRKET